MRLMTVVSLAAVLSLSPVLAQQAPAPESSDRLTGLIVGSHRPLTRTPEGFAGPGAEFLIGAAEQSRFVLLGESHGNVETPELTTWLARAVREAGYSVLAVEVGPITAGQMTKLAGQPDGLAAFQAFHARFPFAIPFFFWREEVAMWLDLHGAGFELWGLDQEFIGSGRFLLGELDGQIEDAQLRVQVEAWQNMANEGFEVFRTSGDSSRGFLNVVSPADLAVFGQKLPPEAHAARRIVDELRETAIVYQHYRDRRYFLNNYDRIRLMKRHLAQYIKQAGGLEATPRALFKFGSVHMGRGYSALHQLDLGNSAAELAALEFSDSLHINVTALASVSRDGTRKDWTAEAPELALFGRHLTDGAWGVFDLRDLRQHFAASENREAQPALAEAVFRFDVLVLVPELHAATPMYDLPF